MFLFLILQFKYCVIGQSKMIVFSEFINNSSENFFKSLFFNDNQIQYHKLFDSESKLRTFSNPSFLKFLILKIFIL